MKLKLNTKRNAFLVFVLSFFLLIIVLPFTLAAEPTHEISTFEELLNASILSKTQGYHDDIYILKNDITITEENQAALENGSVRYISFGSSDVPFSGTFDGQGFTIANLSYSQNLQIIPDTGLFSVTNGATIKNLVIDHADLQADYRGGIVAGYAENTLFENIYVNNSHLFVSSSSNVVTLITDGGIRGGAIVGEAKNSVLYNCESVNNVVNTNNTSGIAAASVKMLTLGALVGISDGTTIEYSRVYGGEVKSFYEVVVGAIGGFNLKVGGIVGVMRGTSKVIDSYSSAHLNFHCATYVGVLAANTGTIGGIVASMEGSEGEIIRSHFAGPTDSYQYNVILLAPVIEENVGISGLVGSYGGGSIVSSFYKPSASSHNNMKVIADSTASTSTYGPLTDDQYIDKNFWASQFYDLSGTIKRSSSYSETHFNKWVIDNELLMPIHGRSLSATLDFENAGKVTIDKTELVNSIVSTTDPYNFATQGVSAEEIKTNLLAEENKGFRFVGWYKIPDISTWTTERDHEFFDKLFELEETVSTDKNYEGAIFDNNDLFIARFQANVVFHDIDGNIIDKDGNIINKNDDKNYYYYSEKIPVVSPKNKPTDENAKLIGWTTEKSNESGGGYSGISTSSLNAIKSNGTFYETGDIILKPLELYPIYIDLLSNITTIFEGNEQDSIDNESLREGVGSTNIYKDSNENVVIEIIGASGDKTLPNGYRFLGWYNEDGKRISTSMKYTLEDIDLSLKQTFTARFEYLVEYMVKACNQGDAFEDDFLYDIRWHKYGEKFQEISGPAFLRETITQWTDKNENRCNNTSGLFEGNIYDHKVVYSLTNGSGRDNYALYVDTDFPNSGTISDLDDNNNFTYTPKSERYKLQFWTLERDASALLWETRTYKNNPMKVGTLPTLAITDIYYARAMVVADVYFYKKDGTFETVKRRYNNPVLMNSLEYTYKYPHLFPDMTVSSSTQDSGTISSSITLESSPTNESMYVDGYSFLGWISSSDVKVGSDEWNKIYDVQGDLYCTSDMDNAMPYIIDENYLTTQAHDIYPVYAKYNIINKVNVSIVNNTQINIPSNPTYIIEEDGVGNAVVTIVPDTDTYVVGSDGEKYELTSVIRLYDDGSEEIILPDEEEKYKYNVTAGNSYTFVVNYEPYVIAAHLNDEEMYVVVKEFGDLLGEIPDPKYNINDFSKDYIFVGYTSVSPQDKGYHKLENYEDYKKLDIMNSHMPVSKPLELWPVYVSIGININSNIDNYLESNMINLSDIRYFTREGLNKIKLIVTDEEIDDYHFVGWYRNYKDKNNPGELVVKNKELTLLVNDSLTNDTYTAVYEEMYTVNYHDMKGNIIYSVDVGKDDNRTFMIQARTRSGEEISSLIDYEAYININNLLKVNEKFINWQWVKNENEIVKWEDFCNEIIISDMDLYPIIYSVSLKDYNDSEININEESSIIDIEFIDDYIAVYLKDKYAGSKLSVHLNEISYTNNKNTIKGVNEYKVNIYNKNDSSVKILEESKTNENGIAIFELYKNVNVKLINNTLSKKDDVFLFKIIDFNEKVIINFMLKNEQTKTFKLPYGKYKIVEAEPWAWKYELRTPLDIEINNLSSDYLEIQKNIKNNKWFDKMTSK